MAGIQENRYEYIDALRGLAILMVIFNHVPESLNFEVQFPQWLTLLQSQGARGVQLFYIISAFTIYLTYSKRKHQEQNLVLNFYIRRFFRIAPLFYICLIFYSLRMYFWKGFGEFTVLKFISAFTFTNGFHPNLINAIIPGGWSVAIEMVFYLCVPLIYIYVNDIKKAFVFLLISLIVAKRLSLLLLKLQIIETIDAGYLFLYLPTQLPYFIMGIIFFFWVTDETKIEVNKKKWGTIFLFLVLFYLVSFCVDGIDFYFPWHFFYALILLFLCYVLYYYPSKILVNSFFIYFGKISYSVYLIHFAFFPLIIKISPLLPSENSIFLFCCVYIIMVILSVVVGTISYQLIEKPFMNLSKKIIK